MKNYLILAMVVGLFILGSASDTYADTVEINKPGTTYPIIHDPYCDYEYKRGFQCH